TAANQQRIPLAKMAVEETGMGIVEDKVIKNHFASEYIYNAYKIESKNDGILGYVSHSYKKDNLYQSIGNFFIGIAPIIGGTIMI
ncbi:hypothetical protein ACTPEM_26060, partial [Clostridioides difficile]